MKKKIFMLPVLLAVLSAFMFSGVIAKTDANGTDLSPPPSIANDAMAAQGSGAVETELVNDATMVNSKNTWAEAGTPMKMNSDANVTHEADNRTEIWRSAPFSDVTKVAGHDETSLISVEMYTTISGAQDRASPVTNLMNTGLTTITMPNSYAYLKKKMPQMTTAQVPIAEFQQINIGMNSSNVANISENTLTTAEDSGIGRASPCSLNNKNGQTELCAASGIYFSHPPSIANNGGINLATPSSQIAAAVGQHDYPNPFNFTLNA